MLLTALALAGHVVLLLWGTRTVQSGVERAFGSDLRRLLGQALRNRVVAVGAGAGVTMLLQSSTATAMMVTTFAARGVLDLVPALAVFATALLLWRLAWRTTQSEAAAAASLKEAEAQAAALKSEAIEESKKEVAKLIVLGMQKV